MKNFVQVLFVLVAVLSMRSFAMPADEKPVELDEKAVEPITGINSLIPGCSHTWTQFIKAILTLVFTPGNCYYGCIHTWITKISPFFPNLDCTCNVNFIAVNTQLGTCLLSNILCTSSSLVANAKIVIESILAIIASFSLQVVILFFTQLLIILNLSINIGCGIDVIVQIVATLIYTNCIPVKT